MLIINGNRTVVELTAAPLRPQVYHYELRRAPALLAADEAWKLRMLRAEALCVPGCRPLTAEFSDGDMLVPVDIPAAGSGS
jgi:hypothetical protein